jgi:glycosyltransferase involved in cell wall biosynthesis
MFEMIKADYYVLVDGDDTYPPESVYELLKPIINEQADMVVGKRLEQFSEKSFRPLHVLGNKVITFLINKIFRSDLEDVMSGYRAFNDKAVSHLPLVAGGFDIETEMTLQCLYYNYVIDEISISYGQRPKDSYSKLHKMRDGFLVLMKIFSLFRAYKPLTFFGLIGILAFALSFFLGSFPIMEYFASGFIKRVPLAILATGLSLVGMVCFAIGITLHTVNFRLKELYSVLKRLKK